MGFLILELEMDQDDQVLNRKVGRYPHETRAEVEFLVRQAIANYQSSGFNEEHGYWWATAANGDRMRFMIEPTGAVDLDPRVEQETHDDTTADGAALPIRFSNIEEVKRWLASQRYDVEVVFAARAALRAVPSIPPSDGMGGRQTARRSRILRIFRFVAVSWATAAYPGHRETLRAAANTAVHTAEPKIGPTSDLIAERAAAYAAAVAGIAAGDFAEEPFVAASYSASATDEGGRAALDGLKALAADAKLLDQRLSPVTLANSQLWPAVIPAGASDKWSGLKSWLLDADEDWAVWTDWYEDRLAGRPEDQALEVARATIPDEIWARGPKVANAHIKRLIEEHGRAASQSRVDAADVPPDPADHEAFQTWLSSKPPQFSIVIATRAALRALSLATLQPGRPFDTAAANDVLTLFRAAAISRFSAAFPNHKPEVRSEAAARAADAAQTADVNSILAADSIRSATLAAVAATDTGLDPVTHTSQNATDSVMFASEAAGGTIGRSAMLSAVRVDAMALHRGDMTPEQLAGAPLWPDEPPWPNAPWGKLSDGLRRLGGHWQNWIDWYERIFQGSPPNLEWSKDREMVFTDLPGALPWDDGAEAVNRAIKERLDTLGGLSVAPASNALPALLGVISPVDFTMSSGRPIRAVPSREVQPAFKTPVDKRDHKPRLDLCRAAAASLLEKMKQHKFNIRDGYGQALSDYIRHLPANTRKRNLLFADQEARILRELFAAEAGILPADFAARLRALLQAHQALRVFYPGIDRFYDDVRFGRSSEPLPIDAVDQITDIVARMPSVFDASVSQALADAAAPIPAPSTETLPQPSAADIQPPPDPLGTLPTEKAQAYTRAGTINRLWAVFQKGESLNKNVEGWTNAARHLVPHVRQVIEWLSSFGGGGPPTA